MMATTEFILAKNHGAFYAKLRFVVPEAEPPKPLTFSTSAPTTDSYLENIVNSTSKQEATDSVFSGTLPLSTGIVSSLGVLLNILMILVIYKGALLRKDHRFVFYMFMSIGAFISSGITAASSLSVSLSGSNPFRDFGSCLMLQATSLGSISMIGISIVLLTIDLYSHLVSPFSTTQGSTTQGTKAAGCVIKCVGCYFVAILVAYLPFFFWTGHPMEVKLCSLPEIYGHHVFMYVIILCHTVVKLRPQPNYLTMAVFIVTTLAIIATNTILIKNVKGTKRRTKLRIQKDVPSSQIRHCRASEELPTVEIVDGVDRTAAPIHVLTEVTENEVETAFVDRAGTGKDVLLNHNDSPKERRANLVPLNRSLSVSEETQISSIECTNDQDVRRQHAPDGATNRYYNPHENRNRRTALAKDSAKERSEEVMDELNLFFVSGTPSEEKTAALSCKTKQKLKESVILSATSLASGRDNVSPKSNRSEKIPSVEPNSSANSDGINGVSVLGPGATKTHTSLYYFCCVSRINKEQRRSIKRGGKSIAADSFSSNETTKEKHVQNRKGNIQKYLKTVKTEMAFALLYILCTLPIIVWNIERIMCVPPCTVGHQSVRDLYFLGMAVLPCIQPILFLLIIYM